MKAAAASAQHIISSRGRSPPSLFILADVINAGSLCSLRVELDGGVGEGGVWSGEWEGSELS